MRDREQPPPPPPPKKESHILGFGDQEKFCHTLHAHHIQNCVQDVHNFYTISITNENNDNESGQICDNHCPRDNVMHSNLRKVYCYTLKIVYTPYTS